MIQEYLKKDRAGQAAPYLYVRINNWETEMTNDDLEAIVHPGLDGVCLAKCGSAENVQRLDWKLEELEQSRGMEVGSVAIQLLIETAKGVINAYLQRRPALELILLSLVPLITPKICG